MDNLSRFKIRSASRTDLGRSTWTRRKRNCRFRLETCEGHGDGGGGGLKNMEGPKE